VKAAEASVKDFKREGMWTVLVGAVLGRWSTGSRMARVAKEGASGATGTGAKGGLKEGGCGIGSDFISKSYLHKTENTDHLLLSRCSLGGSHDSSVDYSYICSSSLQ